VPTFEGVECFYKKTVTFTAPGVEALYRPDFLFPRRTHGVVLEVDRHQHPQSMRKYRPEKEATTMVSTTLALLEANPAWTGVIFLRVNPDKYEIDGESKNPPVEARAVAAWAAVQHWCDPAVAARMSRTNEDGKPAMIVKYMFYDATTVDGVRRRTVAPTMAAVKTGMRLT
jgi:hypothetical protein